MGNKKDLTGQIFGDFRALYFDDTKGKYKYYWVCECINCGQIKSIETGQLKFKSPKCTCNKLYAHPTNATGYAIDLVGQKFGHLTIISFEGSKYSHSQWKCKCDCGNECVKSIAYLHRSKYLMCDECLHSCSENKRHKKLLKPTIPFEEIAYQTKNNKIETNGATTIINDKIIIDTKNIEKILKFKRYVGIASNGYPYINWHHKELFLHRLIMDLPQSYDKETQLIVDHIDGNVFDCRESNLRVCKKSKNAINCKRYKNNKSGVKGISWNPKLNKWQVSLQINKQPQYLGVYTNLDDAIKVRKDAEDKYFGEFKREET